MFDTFSSSGTRIIGSFLLALALSAHNPSPTLGQQAWTPRAPGFPQTQAEISDFQENTGHLEMWAYLEALKGASTEMRLASYGKTWEGRDLPVAIFSRPQVSQPWEAWALNRPIVLVGTNVHGGERTFREGVLILMRDLATPGTAANALLDDVVVLVAPQLNPDGYEASDRGIRGNAWGIDMNRDYVKLEQPALANFVHNLIARWRPHVILDEHNGCGAPYNLCYQAPSNFDSAPEITLLADREVFPGIDAKLAEEGFRSFYYSGGNEEAWRVGGSEARIGRNYAGFTNAMGILFEAPGQEPEDGARAGYLGTLSVIEYTAANARKVMDLIDAARAETVAMGSEPRGEIAVQMEYAPEDYTVDYTIITGGGRFSEPGTPVDTIDVKGAQLLKKPVATKTRPRPWAYILPRDAVEAVALLRRHGISVEVMTGPDSLTVDAYTVAAVTHEQAYNHAAATKVEVGEVVTLTQEFPKGTYVVPTAQFLGRLVTHVLEPETSDNVVYWNTMDAWIPRPVDEAEMEEEMPEGVPAQFRRRGPQGPPVVPIYKLMAPTAISTRLLEDGR